MTPYPIPTLLGIMNLQLHGLQVLGDLEGSGSLAADILDSDALGVLNQSQTLGGADVEHGQVGDDGRDTLGAGQGEGAVGQNLGVTLLVGVLHGDNDLGLLGVGDQIHGTTDTLDLTGKHEVGEI